jgi:beta-galactosidase
MFSLPFKNVDEITDKKDNLTATSPVLKKGSFVLKTVGDTYLNMSKWGKGCCLGKWS